MSKKKGEEIKMTIIEKAHELGEMIKSSGEKTALDEVEERQGRDDEAQKLLGEFNLKRMNLARQLHDGKITQEEAVRQNTESFNELVAKSPVIAEYVEAKKAFDALVSEINGVLNYYITGQEPGCTHDCSTCGGCH